jgi:hypothetical protein
LIELFSFQVPDPASGSDCCGSALWIGAGKNFPCEHFTFMLQNRFRYWICSSLLDLGSYRYQFLDIVQRFKLAVYCLILEKNFSCRFRYRIRFHLPVSVSQRCFYNFSNITACAYRQHLYSGITRAKRFRYRLRLLAPAIPADLHLKVGITNLFSGQKCYRYRYAFAF